MWPPAAFQKSSATLGAFWSPLAYRYGANRASLGGRVVRSILTMTAVLTTLSLGLSACVPVLVGGLIYKSVKSNEEKAAFTTNLQKTNTEREKAKLKPLDWCSEAYKFDKGWATENPECAQRVTAYEAGDKSALTP
jgi:hypothetical protein